ncbi:MAG: hypothetical protein V5A57_00125 [Candidatus Paceibacterota bacterium]
MPKETKKQKILDFIEDNAPKDEFIEWLNTQFDVAFSGNHGWEEVKEEVLDNKKISSSKLQMYAASLNSEQDLKSILKNVEQETEKARTMANKLQYLSKFKKFSISLGGIITLQGLVLIVFGFILLTQLIQLNLPQDLSLFTSIVSIILGIINLISGLLLSTG